jgi:hypothetical protein
VARVSATFKGLSPAYKAVVALVAPIATIIGTLLALNVITPFGDDALAAGIDRTTGAGSAAIDVVFESGDLRFEAAGDFDYRARRGLLHYDYSGNPGSESLTDVEVVYSRGHAYMKLGEGRRPWIHADLATAEEDLEEYTGGESAVGGLGSLAAFDFTDPSQALAQLRRATEVEEVGSETIFGVPTSGYRGTVKARERGGEPVTVTAWIGDDDLIRRLELAGGDLEVTMDFSEFGKPVEVAVPAADQVRELSDVLFQLG